LTETICYEKVSFFQEITIGFGNEKAASADAKRELPVWIAESTVATAANDDSRDSRPTSNDFDVGDAADAGGVDNEDEITSLLLRHEKRGSQTTKATTSAAHNDSESDKYTISTVLNELFGLSK